MEQHCRSPPSSLLSDVEKPTYSLEATVFWCRTVYLFLNSRIFLILRELVLSCDDVISSHLTCLVNLIAWLRARPYTRAHPSDHFSYARSILTSIDSVHWCNELFARLKLENKFVIFFCCRARDLNCGPSAPTTDAPDRSTVAVPYKIVKFKDENFEHLRCKIEVENFEHLCSNTS